MSTTKAWYIRNLPDNEVKGPFPAGQISQEVLLGRHKLDDEVSQDQEVWIKLGEVPEILPAILTENSDDPEIQERLAAARRWADERRGLNVRTSDNHRDKNSEIKRLQALMTNDQSKNNRLMSFVQVGIVLIVMFTIIFLAFEYSPEKKLVINCSSVVAQKTVFDGCDLSAINLTHRNLMTASFMNAHLYKANLDGANLFKANFKYAYLYSASMHKTNLSQANLKGANLVEADLSGANLSSADLSYADLRRANISDTNFNNTDLSNAIWVDGTSCRKGSIGSCN